MSEMNFDLSMTNEYDRGIRRTLPTYDAMCKLTQSYIRAHTTEEADLLVVGAGGGNELVTMGQSNPSWHFTAIDPSSPMIALAQNKAAALQLDKRVEFIEGTVDLLPSDRRFDAATCLLVLHFLPTVEEKRHLLRTIRHHLQDGAPFVMTCMYGNREDPSFEELFSLWKAYWLDSTSLSVEEVDDMEQTVRRLSFQCEEDIRNLLEESGFQHIAKFFSTHLFGGWICRASSVE